MTVFGVIDAHMGSYRAPLGEFIFAIVEIFSNFVFFCYEDPHRHTEYIVLEIATKNFPRHIILTK